MNLLTRTHLSAPMGEDVTAMFDRIAPRYDRANSVLSFGVHGRWRRKAARAAKVPSGGRALDLATGTGDLAFLLEKAAGPEGEVIGSDVSEGMLAEARRKAAERGSRARFERDDAMHLPYISRTFDAVTIAFGIRNVDDPERALREMARVLRPGARAVVLEFGTPQGALRAPYRWYSRFVMPRVGGAITGDREAYEYLPRTAATFPFGEAFAAMMRDAGFKDVKAEPLTGGIAWLYVGVAP